MIFEQCEPNAVFKFFEEMSRIPHGSGNEREISDYLAAFAKERGLWFHQDEALNVIIRKPGTAGYENAQTVILQGHMDMVCEKNCDTVHDFTKDPLKLYVDGDWLRADGTTLGADNAIAVAMGLALLDANDIPHPPIELLATADEEAGMTGAIKLDGSLLQGKMLINIDSEEEGVFLTSCAGGMRAKLIVPLEYESIPEGYVLCNLAVKGLQGGHSGAEIHTERGNSNKILARVLYCLQLEGYELRLAGINGGMKENAIPREAECILAVKDTDVDVIGKIVTELELILQNEYRVSDPGVILVFGNAAGNAKQVFTDAVTKKIIAAAGLLHSGVQNMSTSIDGLVETSFNLGVVSTKETSVEFVCALRSSVVSRKRYVMEQIRLVADALGIVFESQSDYPAWEFKQDSKLLKVFTAAYKEFTGKEPKVTAIHAGLECGYFAQSLAGVDMISMGPDIRGAHTPDERLCISSTRRTWEFLKYVLSVMK